MKTAAKILLFAMAHITLFAAGMERQDDRRETYAYIGVEEDLKKLLLEISESGFTVRDQNAFILWRNLMEAVQRNDFNACCAALLNAAALEKSERGYPIVNNKEDSLFDLFLMKLLQLASGKKNYEAALCLLAGMSDRNLDTQTNLEEAFGRFNEKIGSRTEILRLLRTGAAMTQEMLPSIVKLLNVNPELIDVLVDYGLPGLGTGKKTLLWAAYEAGCTGGLIYWLLMHGAQNSDKRYDERRLAELLSRTELLSLTDGMSNFASSLILHKKETILSTIGAIKRMPKLTSGSLGHLEEKIKMWISGLMRAFVVAVSQKNVEIMKEIWHLCSNIMSKDLRMTAIRAALLRHDAGLLSFLLNELNILYPLELESIIEAIIFTAVGQRAYGCIELLLLFSKQRNLNLNLKRALEHADTLARAYSNVQQAKSLLYMKIYYLLLLQMHSSSNSVRNAAASAEQNETSRESHIDNDIQALDTIALSRYFAEF